MNERATLTEIETAKYLGVSCSTLRQGRMNGNRENRIPSPPFIKLGRSIRYLKEDLDQWLRRYRIDLCSPVSEHKERKQ